MAEVRVTKEPKPEHVATSPRFGLERPFFRTGLFDADPFAMMKHFTELNWMFNHRTTTGAPDVWYPAIEVKEEKGKLLVTAELPGVDKENLRVYLAGDALVVEGARKDEKEEKKEGFFHTERRYGRFFRTIPVPEGTNPDSATARFHNGVLKVALSFAEIPQKAREIRVTEGAPAKAETTH